MTDDFDVDAFLDGYQQRQETVEIQQRGDLVAEHARLEAELARLGETGSSDDDGHLDQVQQVLDRIGETERLLEEGKRSFTVQAISRQAWYDLLADHPPSEKERQRHPQASAGVDFQVHALAACSVSPKLTIEQARRLLDTRADDFDRLWMAVVQANEGGVVVPKSGLASAARGIFEQRSTNRKARRSRGASGPAANGKASRNTTTTKKAASSGRSRRTTQSGPNATGK